MKRVVLMLMVGGASVFVAAACGHASSVDHTCTVGTSPCAADASAETGNAPPGLDAGMDGAPACTGSPLRVYDETPGVLSQVFGQVVFQEQSDLFLIDMGSAYTFTNLDSDAGPDAGPTLVADAGIASISCVEVGMPGALGVIAATTPDGIAAHGTLGCDLVSDGEALDLRISASRYVWWRTPPPPPAGAVVLPAVLGQTSTDQALVVSGVQLDGQDVRLMLDTGFPHVLILSATPRPNETEESALDGNGNPVTIYESTIQIGFNGGVARTVDVDRVVPGTFPDLEGLLAQLGGGIAGLLGLDALGHDRIMISSSQLAFVLPTTDGGSALDGGTMGCYANVAFRDWPWAPPSPLHRGACTSAEIAAYFANATALDGGTCSACITTDQGSPEYGPVIVNNEAYPGPPSFFNVGGCQADEDGDRDAGGCGYQTDQSTICSFAECGTCPDLYAANGPGPLATECINTAFATGAACASTLPSDACNNELNDGGVAASCNVTEYSQLQALVTAWCGP